MRVHRSHISFCIMVAALAAGLASCDLFRTRDPEPPKGSGSLFLPPTAPDIVLENLRRAVSDRNTTNYLRCLVDTLTSSRSYVFIPTAAAAGRYASTFASWSLQSEKSWFSSLAALTPPGATASLALDGGFTVMASDSAIYNGDYLLTFQHGLSGIPETVRGNLQFVMVTDQTSFWSIVRWTDTPIGTEPSWSELKGRFAN